MPTASSLAKAWLARTRWPANSAASPAMPRYGVDEIVFGDSPASETSTRLRTEALRSGRPSAANARACGSGAAQAASGLIDTAHRALRRRRRRAFGALPTGVRQRRWAGPVYGLIVWPASSTRISGASS
jgi:hypothetical protein